MFPIGGTLKVTAPAVRKAKIGQPMLEKGL
jgi:hypothetical protein